MLLSIDQSTSATKAIIFSQRGELLAKASRAHEQIYPQPGWVEHNANEIWVNTLRVIAELAKEQPHLVGEVQFLSISDQRETAVVFDRLTGQPLLNAIVWQCRRGAEICERLASAGHGDYVKRTTGLKLDPYFSASKWNWAIENLPRIAEQLQDGSAVVGTVDTYLIHRLTQGDVFATDVTNASRTLLFDIHKMQWDPNLCELFCVPMRALPKVLDSSAEFGQTDAAGAWPSRIPIRGVMGDSQASLFALGCHQVGDAKVTFGTGSSLLLNTGSECRAETQGTVITLAWSHKGQPTYCLEGIVNYSAATLEWLKNQLRLIETVGESAELAKSVPDNGGVYLVPAFAGLSAPYWKPDARAALVGMSAHTTKAHVVRAALEAIAYQIRDALDMMRQEAGVAPKLIRADGGGVSNEFLMQFTADILQVPLQTCEVNESSPLGAALCGALGGGVLADIDAVSACVKPSTTFQPQMEPATSDALYKGWKDAVRRAL
ncbi:Glycerol kinase [Posidoniimonas corsicana]|uniref:ATP:glycerol 3-phosphotransferase n=1 Tax=Posidoniimonas corsicana TaxID=1938618 RepID=A0A5C5V9F5_9BACT|nr:glycerol kinase GlpK [Posidoniimonas corsicana]TWT35246.1 Glycerol kinase [Posidoniimonas corsicana]